MKITKKVSYVETKNKFEIELTVYLECETDSSLVSPLYQSTRCLLSNTFLHEAGVDYCLNQLNSSITECWGDIETQEAEFRLASVIFYADTAPLAKIETKAIEKQILTNLRYIVEVNRSGALDAEDLQECLEFQDWVQDFTPKYGKYSNGDHLQTSLDRE